VAVARGDLATQDHSTGLRGDELHVPFDRQDLRPPLHLMCLLDNASYLGLQKGSKARRRGVFFPAPTSHSTRSGVAAEKYIASPDDRAISIVQAPEFFEVVHASARDSSCRRCSWRLLEPARGPLRPVVKQKLRGLITDEVAAWSDAYKRGLRAYDLADPDTVAERAYRNLAGYGPLEPLLADDDVWEIMVNSPDQIFVKRHRGTSGYLDEAAGSHRKLDPAEGLRDAQLDTGNRLHIVHGDVGRDGHVLVRTCRLDRRGRTGARSTCAGSSRASCA
jgi:hypothetical protein